MSTSKHLRWLKTDELQTDVAKRFAKFCAEDIQKRAKQDDFNPTIYEDAVRLIINKMERDDEPTEEEQG